MSWHLLIVEDDADIAESLAEVFVARGYKVQVAANGQEAIDIARATGIRPDAILLDLLMPVMDGLDFLGARVTEPLLANVPVIVITAQPSPPAGMPHKVYAKLAKPLPLAQLIDTVQRAVHGSPPGGAAGRSARRAA